MLCYYITFFIYFQSKNWKKSKKGVKKNLTPLKVAPQVGLEPTTLRLTAECSTTELLRNIKKLATSYFPPDFVLKYLLQRKA